LQEVRLITAAVPETHMDMRFMMKQAQQMQAKLLEAQQATRAEGTAGGAVKVTLNGAKELVGVSISKDAMDPEDPSMLEDLIMVAFKDASAKAEAAMSKVTGGMTAGLGIPGLKL
jgi:DNA-binding YbaB/EbfC family protein